MDENSKRPLENNNSLTGSVVIFVVLMAIFLVGLYLVQFLTLDTVWPMAALIGLFALAYFVPMTITGASDSGDEHR
ncbi:hypothetical protein [Sinomonas halotolerans]|uniref:Uncharacterized protein n=1 Tax=Sinomonas halotolerans TaxID=1644133 RepID=A0ABU9WYT4_9MICC